MAEQQWSLGEAAKNIAERFIQSAKGMPVRRVEIHVAGDTQLLGKLEQEAIVWRFGNEYLPKFRALEHVDPQLRTYAERCTETVLKALKWLYTTDDSSPSFNFPSVRSAVKNTFDATAEDEAILLGMLFACDFLKLIGGWTSTPGSRDLSITLRPEILAFENIQAAWENELERRIMETPPQLKAKGTRVLATRSRNPHLIFLSHAVSDQYMAATLKATIEKVIPGSEVFVSSDSEDLRPGDAWVETIRAKLEEASLLLVLATQRSLTRHWVWYETGAGWISGIRVIPCCVGTLRKGQLIPPFHGLQALNADDELDLQSLLKVTGDELGLVRNDLQLSDVIAQLKDLDRKAGQMEPTTLLPEERQHRAQAVSLTVKSVQGNSQRFQLSLKNHSDEVVTIREIWLEAADGTVLDDFAKPRERGLWRIASQETYTVEWQPARNPVAELVKIEGRKFSPGDQWYETMVIAHIHFESLAIPLSKKCPPVRVHVSILNHTISEI